MLGGEVGGSWGGGKVLERQGLGRLRRPPLRPQFKPTRYSVTVVGYHGDITEAGSSGGQERSWVTCGEGGTVWGARTKASNFHMHEEGIDLMKPPLPSAPPGALD